VELPEVLPPVPIVRLGSASSTGSDDADADADMVRSRQLLRAVAGGTHEPVLRLYRPGPTVAFGRRETHHPGFQAAVEAAARHGFTAVVRNTGGRAVAYGPGSLVVELMAADPSPPTRLNARFAAFAERLAAALRTLGVPASVGRLEGEYCPGDYSVIASGLKLAGTAQRLVAGAWLCSASIVVSGAAPLRAVLVDVNAALRFSWRPSTLGATVDLVPSVTVTDVQNAVLAAFGGAAVNGG
jgi:octanoyl-[GcvH]:protein N-octanoyltransferase